MDSHTSSDTVICTLCGVEKRYVSKSAPVLGPVSMEVSAGQIIGIRGANGAGKSTLLGIMSGTVSPDSGSVTYAPGVRERIGYVPQELSLYSSLSGLDNLRFWGLACGLPSKAISARSRWVLEQLELSDKGRKPVFTYSGGMKRRLHLATALMITPGLLLLDEPTVGADSRSIQLMLDTMLHLRELGCGVVFVSHQTDELSQVCDFIFTMENGCLSEGSKLP